MNYFRYVTGAIDFILRRVRGDRRVACRTCPHWLYHSAIEIPIRGGRVRILRAGVCALQAPRIYNDRDQGYALRVMTGEDFCAQHPFYDPAVRAGSPIRYRPSLDEQTAGFSAFGQSVLPSIEEAKRFARGADVQPGEPVPPAVQDPRGKNE